MEDNNNRFDEERLKSLRLEKRALGYLLKSPNKEQDYYDVAPLLTEKSFADKKNQRIFNAIILLLKGGQEINSVSVANKISANKVESGLSGDDIDNYLGAVSFTQANKKGFVETCQELYKFYLRRDAFSKAKQIASEQFRNGDQSPFEIINTANKILDEFKVDAIDGEKPTFILEELNNYIKEKANEPQKAVGIPWPYEELNLACGGLRYGDLHMILAQTGAGKTTFLMDVALKVAMAGYPVIYLNTEMTDNEMRDRLGGMIAAIEPILISTGMLRNEVMEYNKFLEKESYMQDVMAKAGKNLIHKTVSHMSIDEVESYVKYVYNRYVGKGKPCLICYDYLKITGEKTSSHNQEYQIIRNKSSQLKRIALELKSPVLTALQTNRQPDDDTKPLKDVLKVDATAMAMSHSASWDCSFLGYYKQKDDREVELDGRENGSHKLVPLKIRAWGLGGLDYERSVRRETAEGNIFQKNHINLQRGIFTLESVGTLRTMRSASDIQGNDVEERESENDNATGPLWVHRSAPEEREEDDGTL